MKIAQIICRFRPYKGGMNEVAYYFSRELAKKENEVTVFCPLYNKNLQKEEEMEGFKIKRLNPLFKFGNAAFIPSICKKLKGFDVVHLHYPFFGVAEFLWLKKILSKKKIKLIITYHMDVTGKNALKPAFKFHTKFIMPRILKSADKITVSSIDYFKNSNAYCSELMDKVIELPFGVDKNIYKPLDKDKQLMYKYNLENDDEVILMIGGLDKAHYFKGLGYLLRTFKLIRDTRKALTATGEKKNIKIIIIGEGNLKDHYKNIAGQLGIKNQIIFTGGISDEEKIKLINISHINVLPSIDTSEAFGIVLLEAMACAKPVIASNLPGVRSVVEDGVNGLLCEAKNEEALAGKIKYLLDNPYIARQMGAAGFAKIEQKYNWSEIVKNLMEIYKYNI